MPDANGNELDAIESDPRTVLQDEFTRTASGFAERTKGRFDDLDAPTFSRLDPGGSVLEVGAGTGNFLALFEGLAGPRVAFDLTPAMLVEARSRQPDLGLVAGDGARLPFAPNSFDLVASAQMLHHIHDPLPILREMRRVAGSRGRVLIVDQYASERFEEATIMNELELIRDPSHAVSRPPSAFRIMVQSAGLRIVDEKLWQGPSAFSKWMWPGEFPEERIAEVRGFIARFGAETGMGWEPQGNDYVFTRRRIMLLAERG